MNNFEYNQQQYQNPMMGIYYPMRMGLGYPFPPQMYSQFMYQQQMLNPQIALYYRQMMLTNLPLMQNMNINNMDNNNVYLGKIQNKTEDINDNNNNELEK